MFSNKLRQKRLIRTHKILSDKKILDEFILDIAIPIIKEQKKKFFKICIISDNPKIVKKNKFFSSYDLNILSLNEFLETNKKGYDLVLGLSCINFTNKIENDLKKIKLMMTQNSFLLCAYFSENNLYEFKKIMQSSEINLFNGISQRFHPIVDIRDIVNLYNKMGFINSVIQREKFMIEYNSFEEFISHMRKMAITNIFSSQDNLPIGKKFFFNILNMFNDIKDNKITYEFLIATAWRQ